MSGGTSDGYDRASAAFMAVGDPAPAPADGEVQGVQCEAGAGVKCKGKDPWTTAQDPWASAAEGKNKCKGKGGDGKSKGKEWKYGGIVVAPRPGRAQRFAAPGIGRWGS